MANSLVGEMLHHSSPQFKLYLFRFLGHHLTTLLWKLWQLDVFKIVISDKLQLLVASVTSNWISMINRLSWLNDVIFPEAFLLEAVS